MHGNTENEPQDQILRDSGVRLADLATIHSRLLADRLRRLDVVVNRRMISWEDGWLMVHAGESTNIAGDEGVTSAAGLYRPTVTGIETLGKMLGIDIGYMKKLYAEDPARTDIISAMINGRLHGSILGMADIESMFPPDYAPYQGKLMLRLLKPDGAEEGLFRAMLSPRFRLTMDNLDVATAVMDGIAASGVRAIPDTCSLTDRKMTLRFVAPDIAAMAPKFLEGYRSPLDGPGGVQRAGMDRPGMRMRVESSWREWTIPDALRAAAREGQGYPEGQEPVVFGGFIVTNGDSGGSSRAIYPQVRIRLCKNGLTLMAEGDRRVHLGSAQSEGVVEYAADTMAKELELIAKQTRDAVQTYLDEGWFTQQVAEIEDLAETPMGRDAKEAEQVIRNVTRAAKYTQAETEAVWDMFLRGGAVPRVGSLGSAVTAASQTIEDADRAVKMDAEALPLMREAARLARP